jgi:aminopeptidase N
VAPSEPAKIRFEISGDFLIRPAGDNFWLLGVKPWFPQPDFGAQYFTLRTTTRVKRPFIAFAPGKTVSRRTEGDENVLETKVDNPVQFAIVLAGRYEFEEETREGVTVRVASYGMKNGRAIKQLTDLAFGIIAYYQTFLGPFPFPEFNILEINDFGFGQAPPGVVFITKEAFNPLGGESGIGEISLNQLFSQGANERFAHEIAHQYWAHVVKMPSEEEQWLSESFAEYCAALFLKHFKGQATYDNLVRGWRARAADATGVAPIPLGSRVYNSDSLTRFLIRTGLIYDKGAYLLATLHKELGDQTFLTFLKSYQKSFRWKFGSTRNVAGLLQWLTKKDYAPFFEANYWGTGLPPK